MDVKAHIVSGYRKSIQFSGRSSRSEYWVFAGFVMVGLILCFFVTPMLAGLFLLGSALPGTAIAVRRLHDIGRSGWWVVAPALVIPAWLLVWIASAAAAMAVRVDTLDDDRYFLAATGVAFVVCGIFATWLATPSDSGTNAYGQPPEGDSA